MTGSVHTKMFDVSSLNGQTFTGPRSVLRVVQVLARLAEVPGGLTLSQLCRDLDLPKTTLFTLLKVLESAHYLRNDRGVYRLGPEAIALGSAMAETPRRNFPECARGTIESLCQRTGETCFLAVLTDDNRFCKYVAVAETENWLRFSVKLGSHKPSYATGTGRAMLAYLPDDELGRLLDATRFERITSKTVGSRRALLRGLNAVRKRGASLVEGGTVSGVVSVAAPVFGVDGRICAAVSVGGPSERLLARIQEVERAVCAAAEEISGLLGYRGEWPAPR